MTCSTKEWLKSALHVIWLKNVQPSPANGIFCYNAIKFQAKECSQQISRFLTFRPYNPLPSKWCLPFFFSLFSHTALQGHNISKAIKPPLRVLYAPHRFFVSTKRTLRQAPLYSLYYFFSRSYPAFMLKRKKKCHLALQCLACKLRS